MCQCICYCFWISFYIFYDRFSMNICCIEFTWIDFIIIEAIQSSVYFIHSIKLFVQGDLQGRLKIKVLFYTLLLREFWRGRIALAADENLCYGKNDKIPPRYHLGVFEPLIWSHFCLEYMSFPSLLSLIFLLFWLSNTY